MGVAATLVPKGLGSQDPTKKLTHRVELLGQPLFISKKCFPVFKKFYNLAGLLPETKLKPPVFTSRDE